jgi:hypothetical protein
MPCDWETRYGCRPLLLETLCGCGPLSRTCYRAANWIHIGQTVGCGRMDREREAHGQTVKDIYVYPLVRRRASAVMPRSHAANKYLESFSIHRRRVTEGVITHADYSLVTSANPAVPGEQIVVWMTAFFDVAVIPDSGFGIPLGATATTLPTATLSGTNATVTYAGLTYGAIGLAQVQIELPGALPAGNPLSLQITAGSYSSQIVPLWVKPSGAGS